MMFLPNLFHEDVCGTRVAYGPGLSKESLSVSLSSDMMWRWSLCVRLVGRAGEEGGALPLWLLLGGDGGGAVARILARVCACAGELRLMRIDREEVHVNAGIASGGCGSDARNASRAWLPPPMEQMWMGP